MFIDELKRELTGTQLAVWLGVNEDGTPCSIPADKRERYKALWREQAASPERHRHFRDAIRGNPKRNCGCKGG